MIRLLSIVFGFYSLVMGQNLLDPFYELKPIVREQSQCKTGIKNTICLHKKLTIPRTDIVSEELKPIMTRFIDSSIKEYDEATLSKYFTDDDFDKEELMNSNYEVIRLLALFDYNKPIITLMTENYNYLGGAHGYETRGFVNYDLGKKREIELGELVDFNNTQFKEISELIYRMSEALLPGESKENACWIVDEFDVTTNYGLTKRGFVFHYDPYEIKAYACGMTEFVVPYYKIKLFLKRKFLKDIASQQKHFITIQKKIDLKNGRLMFKIKRIKNRKYNVQVYSSSDNSKKIRLSISFPNLKSSKYISRLFKVGRKDLKLYKIGSKIYSKKSKKIINIKYPLIESVTKGYDQTLTFVLQIPKKLPYICMNYRASIREKSLLKDYDYHQFFDQQGFKVERICFGE